MFNNNQRYLDFHKFRQFSFEKKNSVLYPGVFLYITYSNRDKKALWTTHISSFQNMNSLA